MPNTLTRIIRLLDSRLVGVDPYGNYYYTRKKPDPWGRLKRFVVYRKKVDASLVPPEYHAWLHYTVDEFPNYFHTADTNRKEYRQVWQKPPEPNLKGSAAGYKPKKAQGTGDYQSWSPKK